MSSSSERNSVCEERGRREVSKRKSECEQRVSVCECACVWVRVRERESFKKGTGVTDFYEEQ